MAQAAYNALQSTRTGGNVDPLRLVQFLDCTCAALQRAVGERVEDYATQHEVEIELRAPPCFKSGETELTGNREQRS
jgi:hypothetical protein